MRIAFAGARRNIRCAAPGHSGRRVFPSVRSVAWERLAARHANNPAPPRTPAPASAYLFIPAFFCSLNVGRASEEDHFKGQECVCVCVYIYAYAAACHFTPETYPG